MADRATGDDGRREPDSPVKRFFTSVPGVLAGLATVVTAVATIVNVLPHHDSPAPQAAPTVAPPATDGAGTGAGGTAPVTSAPASDQSGLRRLWGPAALSVTNGGTDLTDIPPVGSSDNDELDVYDDGDGFAPMDASKLAVWHGSSAPTPAQCLDLVRSEGADRSVDTSVGTIVCLRTHGGNLVIIKVLSKDSSASLSRTTTSIWTAN